MNLFARRRHSTDAASHPGAPGKITPGEAARAAADGRVLLLDVREADEWAAGHAPHAVHRPLGALDPQQVPTDRPVVTVCRSGNRSAKAARRAARRRARRQQPGRRDAGLGRGRAAGHPRQ